MQLSRLHSVELVQCNSCLPRMYLIVLGNSFSCADKF